MNELSYYSPGRAKQLTILLWAAVVLAGLGAGLAGFLVGTGHPGSAIVVGVPAFLVLGTAAMAMRALREGTFAAKPWSAAAGAVLILTGLFLAGETDVSILPSIVGILLVLLALLGDHGER
jgi:hypothetical protein